MTGNRQTMRKGWRPLVAIAASWLLVLQVLLTGLSVTGHAAPAGGDSFVAAICTPDGIKPAPGQPAQPHDLTCCLIGCGSAGPAVAPPVAVAEVVEPAVSPIRRPVTLTERPVAGLRYLPGSARAPPTMA